MPPCDVLTLRKQGVGIPLEVNPMGRYVLRAVAFGYGPPKLVGGPKVAAPYFEWAFVSKRPFVSNGGLRLPLTDAGFFRFEPPQAFSACKTVTLGDAGDGCPSDPEKTIMKLRVNWGHSSAQQFERVSVESDGDEA